MRTNKEIFKSIETIYVHPGESKFYDLNEPLEDSNIASSFEEWASKRVIEYFDYPNAPMTLTHSTEYDSVLKTLDVKFMLAPVASFNGRVLQANSEVLTSVEQLSDYEFIFSIRPHVVVDNTFTPVILPKIRGVKK